MRSFLLQIIQQAWPFIGQYLEKLLVETIAPAIRASSIHLQTLSFTKVNIGDKVSSSEASDRAGMAGDDHAETDGFLLLPRPQAVKVVGVKAYTEQNRRQVMLDLYLR